MARTSRRRVLLAVALGLDAVAIALLVGDVAAAYQRAVLPVLLLSFFGIPFALAGAVTTGVHLVRSVRRAPRWVLVVGTVVITVATVPIGGAALAGAFATTPNPAASAEAPLGRAVETAGGRRLCGAGDPGLGPDNTQPYFFALYEVPDGVDVGPRLIAQAQRMGWTASTTDTATDGGLGQTRPHLQVDEGSGLGDGACGEYGEVERASAGMRLVQLEVTLPYRR
jgi:hypothetical protein